MQAFEKSIIYLKIYDKGMINLPNTPRDGIQSQNQL